MVEGSTITEVRRLTDQECSDIGIPTDNIGNTMCLVLSTGSILFPVSDRAMNRGGGWCGDTENIKSLEGKTINSVAPMSEEYMEYLSWENNTAEIPVVLTLDDEIDIYTGSDPEGNSAGLLFEYDSGTVYEISFN